MKSYSNLLSRYLNVDVSYSARDAKQVYGSYTA